MTISSELSSEIAAALLTGKKSSPRELDELKELVLRIHSELQHMAADSRIGALRTNDRIKDAQTPSK